MTNNKNNIIKKKLYYWNTLITIIIGTNID
jgi:hypothetical protein